MDFNPPPVTPTHPHPHPHTLIQCLLADTVLLLLLYLLDTGFSTDAAYEAGVRDYDVRRSVSDVLLVSFAKVDLSIYLLMRVLLFFSRR